MVPVVCGVVVLVVIPNVAEELVPPMLKPGTETPACPSLSIALLFRYPGGSSMLSLVAAV